MGDSLVGSFRCGESSQLMEISLDSGVDFWAQLGMIKACSGILDSRDLSCTGRLQLKGMTWQYEAISFYGVSFQSKTRRLSFMHMSVAPPAYFGLITGKKSDLYLAIWSRAADCRFQRHQSDLGADQSFGRPLRPA